MGYLLYVSHDAENLQFYLWFQDYARRFAATSRTEQALSPRWDDDGTQAFGNDPGPRMPDKPPGLRKEFEFSFDRKEISLESIFGQQSFFSGSAGSMPAHSIEVAKPEMGAQWQSCESGMPPLIYQSIDSRSHNPAFSLRNRPNHLPLPRSRLTPRAQSLPERPHCMRRFFLPSLLQSAH